VDPTLDDSKSGPVANARSGWGSGSGSGVGKVFVLFRFGPIAKYPQLLILTR
jgi:hypothetical protein